MAARLNRLYLRIAQRTSARRLLEPIGNIPPAEFEALYYQRVQSPTMRVGLN